MATMTLKEKQDLIRATAVQSIDASPLGEVSYQVDSGTYAVPVTLGDETFYVEVKFVVKKDYDLEASITAYEEKLEAAAQRELERAAKAKAKSK